MYAPVESKEIETETFYKQLQSQMKEVNRIDYLVIAGDFNGRVGNSRHMWGKHCEWKWTKTIRFCYIEQFEDNKYVLLSQRYT
mgnify:CR=1 FL=1